MKIPKRLKVGAHTFDVKLVLDRAEDDFNTNDHQGCCKIRENIILIAGDQTESQIGATFVHEILHALNSELDHALLSSLAEQIYQVFSDNKLLR